MTLWTVLDLTDAGSPAGREVDRVSIVLDSDLGRAEQEARELNRTHPRARFLVYAVVPAGGGHKVDG